MTEITQDKKTDEIKQLMKIKFTLLTVIIIAGAITFGADTDDWARAAKIAAALLTGVSLMAPLIYSRAKQRMTKFTNYH